MSSIARCWLSGSGAGQGASRLDDRPVEGGSKQESPSDRRLRGLSGISEVRGDSYGRNIFTSFRPSCRTPDLSTCILADRFAEQDWNCSCPGRARGGPSGSNSGLGVGAPSGVAKFLLHLGMCMEDVKLSQYLFSARIRHAHWPPGSFLSWAVPPCEEKQWSSRGVGDLETTGRVVPESLRFDPVTGRAPMGDKWGPNCRGHPFSTRSQITDRSPFPSDGDGGSTGALAAPVGTAPLFS